MIPNYWLYKLASDTLTTVYPTIIVSVLIQITNWWGGGARVILNCGRRRGAFKIREGGGGGCFRGGAFDKNPW